MPNDESPRRTAADKDKTRQQSRAVSGREAARGVASKPGGPQPSGRRQRSIQQSQSTAQRAEQRTKGRNGKARTQGRGGPSRPGNRRPTGPRRSPATLLTWAVVAVVIIIVVVLVVVKVTGGNSSSGSSTTAASPSVVQDVTHVPASVFDTVGVHSSQVSVTPPSVVHGQPPLTFTVDGKTLPGVFFLGAEYCPYCAAERWAIAVAMSRFGTFTNLGATESSTQDVDPGTQTLSFYKATYASPYVAFQHLEAYSNQLTPSGSGYVVLQTPNAEQKALVAKYDTSKYISSLSSSTGSGSIPFMSFGNKALLSGASYSPSVLQGLSREQIAGGLSDPSNPVTQAIIATANYLSASTCAADGGQPGSVCTSKGVTTAAKSMGLTLP
jgi:hypothetical protein